MEEQLLKYLNRNYTRVCDRIVSVNGRHEWGDTLAHQLSIIFSESEELTIQILRNWFLAFGEVGNDSDWFKPVDNTILNMVEPKMINRFIITFPESFNIPSYVITRATRPQVKLNTISSSLFTSYMNYEWEPMIITLLDVINPSTTQSLMALLQNNNLRGFDFKLEMLDPTGVVIEKWKFTDCAIQEIKFGELNYNSNDIVECSLSIIIGEAILTF